MNKNFLRGIYDKVYFYYISIFWDDSYEDLHFWSLALESFLINSVVSIG